MAVKSSALSSTVRPFRARASRGAATPRGRLHIPKNYLSVLDFDAAGFAHMLDLGARLKSERKLGRRAPTAQALAGQHVALLFDKPSLRTRATFEIAIHELGADVIAPPQEGPLGARETVADVARNLERWVSCVVVRTFGQDKVVALAEAAPRLRVINALTNEEHPCQAAADLLTLHERWGGVGRAARGRTIAYVGDGNNVAASLVQAALLAGVSVRVATPKGDGLPAGARAEAERIAQHGATFTALVDPVKAVTGVDAVYTDVWTSMGKENEAASRLSRFRPYQVNAALMAHAKPDAVFMHCLPAHRGDEVTDEVMDGPQSVVFDQSENRLHAQKALLLLLVG
ncbi:MAG: ornithine carbamoyltransferase [Vicinamibacteraceae bacterium]